MTPGSRLRPPALDLSPSGGAIRLRTGGARRSDRAVIRLQALGGRWNSDRTLHMVVARPSGSGDRRPSLVAHFRSQTIDTAADGIDPLLADRTRRVPLAMGQKLRFGRRRSNGSIDWLRPLVLDDRGRGMTVRLHGLSLGHLNLRLDPLLKEQPERPA